ncbi:MAG: hypothetical protein L0229_00995 [Blastocatellia bacterium]|nr:hypothetical protein [Blastocatellia bacterium]
MAKMGKYCKAYPLARLRQFGGWKEITENARKEKRQIDGTEMETLRELTDSDFLYLQSDFTVTDGIFLGENVIFDDLTPEWIEFCKTELQFEIPAFSQETPGDQAESRDPVE